MRVIILGKQSFVSKNGKQCNILHVCHNDEKVEGSAVQTFFVNDDLFRKVSVRGQYDVVYGAYSNGRAFVSDLVTSGSHD